MNYIKTIVSIIFKHYLFASYCKESMFTFLFCCFSGVHHKNSCKSTATLRRVQKLLALSSVYFYPQNLILTRTVAKKTLKKPKGNGGWGDIRDHNLCLKMVHWPR